MIELIEKRDKLHETIDAIQTFIKPFQIYVYFIRNKAICLCNKPNCVKIDV